MIPLMIVEAGEYCGIVAASYDLDGDLAGGLAGAGSSCGGALA